MIRNLLFSLLLLCSLVGNARSIYVVSVGICDYKYVSDLRQAETDAKNIAELYRTQTNNVITLLGSQATHDNIISTLNTFFSTAEEDDIIVFFFSGHGTKGGLCAYDSRTVESMVSYDEIQNAIRSCKAKNKQLLIDACFSGGLRTTKKTEKMLSKQSMLSTTKGVMLFLSSRTSETSFESIWADNGFFTLYLIKGMKGEADADKDRIVTAKEIFTYVSKNVSEQTRKKQNPVMWGKFSDDMEIMNWNSEK